MSSSAKSCAVCHTGYRGLYILHVATAGHQHKLHPVGKPTWSKGKERGRQAGRVLRYDESEGKVKVDRYRRSKPLDGLAKVVRVRDYWRDRARRHASSYGYVPAPRYVQPFRRGEG